MHLFRKLGVTCVTLAALAGALLVVSPTADAVVTPVLTLTPSTDVADGGTITVEGVGFKPSTAVYIVECATADQADCDVLNVKQVTADAGGMFTTQVTVHTGQLGLSEARCEAGGQCLLAAGDPTDAANTGSAPFTFADAPKAVATKTTASLVKASHKIAGTVTAGGEGVKGLHVKLQHLVGKAWKTVATLTTAKSGAFTSKPVDDAGRYRASTPKQGAYKGSVSAVVKVA